jgi:hypothetical protein
MFIHQKGIIPFITTFLGIAIPCTFFLGAIVMVFPGFASAINAKPFGFVVEKTIQLLIGLALYLIFPFFFGILFSGLFPAIRSTKDGLKYMYFGGLIKRKIKWNEIDRWVELPLGLWALIIDRPGLPVFNGLFVNALYGGFLRLGEPVILFSFPEEDRNKIDQEITQHRSRTA